MARTISCKCCGEVVFYIIPNNKHIEYKCEKCCNISASKTTQKYEVYDSICKQCGQDKFKIRIMDTIKLNNLLIECISCKEEPNTYYVDKESNMIDKNTRDLLILQDEINEIKYKYETLSAKINEIESTSSLDVDNNNKIVDLSSGSRKIKNKPLNIMIKKENINSK